jgi:hypothetical protein
MMHRKANEPGSANVLVYDAPVPRTPLSMPPPPADVAVC